eukprot:scaffold20684_cov52-Attheya_sp.AAC.1
MDDPHGSVCLAAKHQVIAIVVRRRCLGRNLAFAHVRILEADSMLLKELGCDDTSIASFTDSDCSSSIGTIEADELRVVFRRNSTSWDSARDDTFPTKNSSIPYGAVVKLDLLSCTDHDEGVVVQVGTPSQKSYEVIRWSILVEPREQAVNDARQTAQTNNSSESSEEGVSCSKYFTSRMNQYLKYNPHQREKKNTKQLKQLLNPPPQDQNMDAIPSHGNKKHKALRAKIFASFLMETFGQSMFQKGDDEGYILDIAGGGGKLSLELALQCQSQCFIIDPLIRGKKDTQQFSSRDIKRIEKVNGIVPKHMAKCFMLNDVCLDLVKRSSCIVGLHPDECTEDILDAAIQLEKPAAIIPCCVFASLRPDRCLASGRIVCTYNDFLDYLMEKDERIKRFELPFEGWCPWLKKNQSLFTLEDHIVQAVKNPDKSCECSCV